MTFLVSELLSPSQIGPARTRMSAAMTLLKISGHSSFFQPCSRMSGQTPVAISGWSMVRMSSVLTPCFSMMPGLILISRSVWLGSGDLVSVPLKNMALRPVKSHFLSVILDLTDLVDDVQDVAVRVFEPGGLKVAYFVQVALAGSSRNFVVLLEFHALAF